MKETVIDVLHRKQKSPFVNNTESGYNQTLSNVKIYTVK